MPGCAARPGALGLAQEPRDAVRGDLFMPQDRLTELFPPLFKKIQLLRKGWNRLF